MDQLRGNESFGRNVEGQRHDRIPRASPLGGIPTSPFPESDEYGEIEITTTQKMLSAISGSLLTSLLVTPLDVVRVRLQSQPNPSPLNVVQKLATSSPSFSPLPANLGVTSCCREVFFMGNNAEYCLAETRIGAIGQAAALTGVDCAVEETQKRTYSSTLDGLRKIARNEGVTTLWRGLSPTLVMAVPANIIYFTQYDWLRFNKASPINKYLSDGYAPLIAGIVARTLAAVVVSPIELFRTQMQAMHPGDGTGHFAAALKDVGELVNTRGYTSLWRGLTLTLWRDVPFSAMYWWGYETIRGYLTDTRERSRGRELPQAGQRSRVRSKSQSLENHSATFADSFIAGATSGAVSSILTMPFDVGKTRRQVFTDAVSVSGATAPQELSMIKFMASIFREEGIAGLWKGWFARTLKVAPACAIMISSYEVGKAMSRSVNKRKKERAIP